MSSQEKTPQEKTPQKSPVEKTPPPILGLVEKTPHPKNQHISDIYITVQLFTNEKGRKIKVQISDKKLYQNTYIVQKQKLFLWFIHHHMSFILLLKPTTSIVHLVK